MTVQTLTIALAWLKSGSETTSETDSLVRSEVEAEPAPVPVSDSSSGSGSDSGSDWGPSVSRSRSHMETTAKPKAT